MTVRETRWAFDHPLGVATDRAGRSCWPSQRSAARLLRYRIELARVRRVGACMREDTARGGAR